MSNKRLNYFRGQLLNEDDFKDEQAYHIKAMSTHNKNLHTWGITKGLDVTTSDDKMHLRISKGMAIDKKGRQIIIDDSEIEVYKSPEQSFYLTVLYEEVKTDTRVEEKHHFYQENNKPDNKSERIILAKVIKNPETGIIEKIDMKDRKYAGVGQEQIVDRSVPISKMKSNPRGGSGSINRNGIEKVDTITIIPHQDPEKNHRFFFTSVIPTGQDSSIEWWFEVENSENEINYNLWVKNKSEKTIEYHYKIYEISEI